MATLLYHLSFKNHCFNGEHVITITFNLIGFKNLLKIKTKLSLNTFLLC